MNAPVRSADIKVSVSLAPAAADGAGGFIRRGRAVHKPRNSGKGTRSGHKVNDDIKVHVSLLPKASQAFNGSNFNSGTTSPIQRFLSYAWLTYGKRGIESRSLSTTIGCELCLADFGALNIAKIAANGLNKWGISADIAYNPMICSLIAHGQERISWLTTQQILCRATGYGCTSAVRSLFSFSSSRENAHRLRAAQPHSRHQSAKRPQYRPIRSSPTNTTLSSSRRGRRSHASAFRRACITGGASC